MRQYRRILSALARGVCQIKTGALYGIVRVSFGAGSLAGDELVITYINLGQSPTIDFSKFQGEFEAEFKRKERGLSLSETREESIVEDVQKCDDPLKLMDSMNALAKLLGKCEDTLEENGSQVPETVQTMLRTGIETYETLIEVQKERLLAVIAKGE